VIRKKLTKKEIEEQKKHQKVRTSALRAARRSGKSIKEKPLENPRDLLVNRLGFRGLEVLENAEFQFPNETKIIVEKLSELIKTGEISEILDGGKLLALFRSVGLSVRMATKIHIEQDGKFVSLSDKLSDKSSVDK